MLTRFLINKLQSIDILSIAEDLDITVKHNKCRCPFHEDKTPSMKLWPAVNGWKCYGCGAKGTNIDLVMKYEGLSFHDACKWIAERHNISLEYEKKDWSGRQHSEDVKNRKHRNAVKIYPDVKPTNNSSLEGCTLKMDIIDYSYIQQCQGTSNAFCRSIVSSGILTQEQLNHAVAVYHLGQTNDDGVIFWQIDQDQQIRDGKVMFYKADCRRDRNHVPTWISFRLKKKGFLTSSWKASYCLFGLHLLRNDNVNDDVNDNKPIVAIVESEKTAIICSELYPTPSIIWLATGGMDALTVDSLRPLIGYKVIVFPDTDPRGETYKKWQTILNDAKHTLGQSFYLSNILEKHATEDQKHRKIDLADYLLEATIPQ